MFLDDVRARWITQRDLLRKFDGEVNGAKIIEEFLADLDQLIATESDEVLTIPEAAEISGFSSAHLRRLVRHGQLHNVGRRHAPRMRRGQLPRKTGHLTDDPRSHILTTKAQIVRSIVHPTRNNDG
jgi:hypothetical protein